MKTQTVRHDDNFRWQTEYVMMRMDGNTSYTVQHNTTQYNITQYNTIRIANCQYDRQKQLDHFEMDCVRSSKYALEGDTVIVQHPYHLHQQQQQQQVNANLLME